MASIKLFLQNNRVLNIYYLEELEIWYYPKYRLYLLYYWDNRRLQELIYSSEDFSQLLQFEELIPEAYQKGIRNLSLK